MFPRLFALLSLIWILTACESSRHVYSEFFGDSDLKNSSEVQVTKVIDGDTFWVRNAHGESFKVRLIGVDAPEPRNVFKKKKHPFGKHSSAYLHKLLDGQSAIQLEFDVDSLDQFGRTLAYAYLPDGRMINQVMIANGFAVLMTIPPNIKYEKLFAEGQNNARNANLGIWGTAIQD